jgi:hypothetical protein
MKGEVMGLNTWNIPGGQQLNFATSADNIRKFLADASKAVKPWKDLPEWKGAGEDGEGGPSGNAGKTLKVWKEMNRALLALNKEIEVSEKKIKAIAPANPAKPMAGLTARMNKKSKASEAMGKAYKEYASKIRAIDTREADPRVINITVNESDLAQQTADTCHEIAMNLSSQTDLGIAEAMEIKLFALKEITQKIRSQREVLREIFCHQYNQRFPTLEETPKEDAEEGGNTETTPNKNARPKPPKDKDESSAGAGDDDEDGGYRTWTSLNGKFQVRAKLVQVKEGMVTLVTPKGKRFTVPKDKLSEVDQRFIEEAASSSSSSSE